MEKTPHSNSFGVAGNLSISLMSLRNASFVERLQAITTAGFQVMDWRFEDIASAAKDGLNKDDFVKLIQTTKVQLLDIAYFREWIGKEDETEFKQNEAQLFNLSEK